MDIMYNLLSYDSRTLNRELVGKLIEIPGELNPIRVKSVEIYYCHVYVYSEDNMKYEVTIIKIIDED